MSTNGATTAPQTGGTSFFQLLLERRTRDALYHASSYWDARAQARGGLARSMWPSNVFNAFWDARQREVLLRALGDLRGRRVLDVGCGTGRMTRFFADAGAAEAVGVDFSAATVEAARRETEALGGPAARVRFAVGDVLAGLTSVGRGEFDDALALGCLSVACRDGDALQRALGAMAATVKPGGRVVLLEPIHRSPLLRRVLDLSTLDWVARANAQGLALIGADCMGFAPARLVLSVRDLPRPLVGAAFHAGEALLDAAPYMAPLADYKLLVFRVSSPR